MPAGSAQEPNVLAVAQALYVRHLLEDRFALKAHLDKREMPVYELTAPNGARGMRPSTLDCSRPEDRPKCGVSFQAGHFSGPHFELSNLVGILGSAVGRPVLDRTNLTGAFDIDLRFAMGHASPDAVDQQPSIFTAVQEQLGLKLQSTTAPVDVLVVDHIEKPTAD